MSVISMKQLLEAGVHFGHQTRRWNPKMAEYIYTERNGIYIIDLQKSVGKVDEAYNAVKDIVAEGGKILFVGTKKQAQDSIKTEAERCGMYYVNERWLGGMLTNFKTIQTRIKRLKWLSNPGYVDYICPQVYYGYDNATCPYAETVKKWADMIKVDGIKLYVGIGAYKIGTEDTWAGAGRDEWLGTTDLLARMVTTARDAKHYGGVAFYSYESLFVSPGRQMQAEERNLKKIF